MQWEKAALFCAEELLLFYLVPHLGGASQQVTCNIIVQLRTAHSDLSHLHPEMIHIHLLLDCREVSNRKVQDHKPAAAVHFYNFTRKARFRGHDDLWGRCGKVGPGARRGREWVKSLRAEPIALVGTARQGEQARQKDGEPESHSTSKIFARSEVNSQVAAAILV
jgi:hypothetical protein